MPHKVKVDLRRFRVVKLSLQSMGVKSAAKKHRLSITTVRHIQKADTHEEYQAITKSVYQKTKKRKKAAKRDIVVKKSKSPAKSIAVTTSAVREARELDSVPQKDEPLFGMKPSLLDRFKAWFMGKVV